MAQPTFEEMVLTDLAKLDQILNGLDNLAGRVGLLEGRFDKLEKRFDQLEKRFDQLEKRLDRFEKKTEKRFDKLERKLDQTIADMAPFIEQLTVHDVQIKRQQASIVNHDQRLAALEKA